MSDKLQPKKILIIGGVAGGATAAARARREDEHAEITVLEKGPYVSFANCGLPYYIGRDIKKRDALLLQTPEGFWSRYRVKVLIQTEATDLDLTSKIVKAKSPQGDLNLQYDKLIISQGATPLVPPVKGGDKDFVFSLRDMNDMDRIDHFVELKKPQTAVVVGGGFIGIEMAEALIHRGLKVHLVEKAPQVMSLMDEEFGRQIQDVLEHHQIKVHLNTSITEIQSGPQKVILEKGEEISAELVLFSIGVKPELALAQKAGLKMGSSGGLLVNEFLQTSDPHVFAVGDMVEIKNRITDKWVRIPLAGPANRQGRIVAQNALGDQPVAYHGSIGSSVVKVFDHTAASSGLSERLAKLNQLQVSSVTVHPRHHAGYYPGAQQLSLKLIYETQTGVIIGGQAFGKAGVEKRIDVIATAIHGKMTVHDLEELDLCYAPPYSSANDPVNMAGFVASNAIKGFSKLISAKEFLNLKKDFSKEMVLDVREVSELSSGFIEGSTNIPLPELRHRLPEIDKSKTIYVHCAVGYRGHLAYRILVQNGFKNVINISGGYKSLEIFQRLM